jgi:hypothetical protein
MNRDAAATAVVTAVYPQLSKLAAGWCRSPPDLVLRLRRADAAEREAGGDAWAAAGGSRAAGSIRADGRGTAICSAVSTRSSGSTPQLTITTSGGRGATWTGGPRPVSPSCRPICERTLRPCLTVSSTCTPWLGSLGSASQRDGIRRAGGRGVEHDGDQPLPAQGGPLPRPHGRRRRAAAPVYHQD